MLITPVESHSTPVEVPTGPFLCFDIRGGFIPVESGKSIRVGNRRVYLESTTRYLRAARILCSSSGAPLLEPVRSEMAVDTHCILLLSHPIGTHGNKISGDNARRGHPFLPLPATVIARGIVALDDGRYGNCWLLLVPKDQVIRASTVGEGPAQTDYYLFNGKGLVHRTRDQRRAGDEIPGFPIASSPAWRLELEGQEWFLRNSLGGVVRGSREDWDRATRCMLKQIESPDEDEILYDPEDSAEGPNGVLYNNAGEGELTVDRPIPAVRWIRRIVGLDRIV